MDRYHLQAIEQERAAERARLALIAAARPPAPRRIAARLRMPVLRRAQPAACPHAAPPPRGHATDT